MRPLVIVCDSAHAEMVRQGLARYCHPALFRNFILLLSIDTGLESHFDHEKRVLIDWLKTPPPGSTEHALICATHAAAKAMGLHPVARAFRVEVRTEAASKLAIQFDRKGPPPIQRLLNQCNLSLRSASAHMLSHWGHATLDRTAVDRWVEQFCVLGQYKWIAEDILGSIRLIEQSMLGDMLGRLNVSDTVALCVNRDPRGSVKSGEIVANVLGKRNSASNIHQSPAKAIEEEGETRIALFEDGLWSGTEAVGVVESLLGVRPPERLKTEALKDPSALSRIDMTLAYGVATDYGQALVRRFLHERGLTNIKVWSDETVSVASPELLQRLATGPFDLEDIRHNGPAATELAPHVLQVFDATGRDARQIAEAREFVLAVGRQLLDHYLEGMRDTKGWGSWPEEKRRKASLGMHGLGLTHAFGHSVPKASLPLLWAGGKVDLGTRQVMWRPLFENA